MTSNDSFSHSPSATTLRPPTYEQLLTEPVRLRRVVQVLRSQGWEELEEWFLAERQEHLERSVDSVDPAEREGHRTVARWLRHFLTVSKEYLMSSEAVGREVVPPGETEYMDHDSDFKTPRGNGSALP